MSWTLANVKNPKYTKNHEIFVGTHSGTFKKLQPGYEENPFKTENLRDIKKLDNYSSITALAFGKDAEILIGQNNKIVNLYSSSETKVKRELEVKSSPVVGVARFDDQIIAGFGDGGIEVQLIDEFDVCEKSSIKCGDDMSHLRQCPSQRNLIATGGKGRPNNLKVFDIAVGGKLLFTSKNLPNDYLQLEVPVWDSDICFIDSSHTLGTCSRYGYVRVYDTRQQRRPVKLYSAGEKMSFSTLTAHGNYIYTGTTMGVMKAFDIRSMKNFVHTYKGFTGSISDLYLDETGKYLASASLDRFVRVHDVDSCVLMYQCYVKSKATKILIRESLSNPNAGKDADKIEDIKKQNVKIVKKNKEANLSEDEEYEDLFDKLQTIREKPYDDDDDDVVDDNATKAQTDYCKTKIEKRKGSTSQNLNNKRKKK